MPKIRISNKQRLLSAFNLIIYLDDRIIGILPLNETREFELPAGEHKIKAKWSGFGSKDYSFTLYNRDIRSFTIMKNYVWDILFIIFITAVAALQALTLQNKGVSLGLIFIGLIYFLLIRRNSFLKIKEDGHE
jgi:hypothetical protein